MNKLLLLLLLVASAAGCSFFLVARASCIPSERDALLALKRAITGDPGGRLASWREQQDHDCCRWGGVRCSNVAGRPCGRALPRSPD
ncbi:hypothetical protein BDA96_10G229900 [Sorghum bicolor]|uniref:Leucine-rich repeat-containing N-terminal plant-type domain-containing protein n=2 Tax=Sorghum bicolor TaxID=4558 RepID=A0A921Q3W1_SORBI|nr:hypothetical protein BDA96_10G229900 [Sorghum bicolor]OQU76613.1 hypothetical protein SORBI_3010G174600 [Sorghum bicolor]